jgi:hypothetical protein
LVNTSNTSLVCTYRKNVVGGTTYAAGFLFGITENLPTITTPSPIITPIFVNGVTTTEITITKPVSTNTASGFRYEHEGTIIFSMSNPTLNFYQGTDLVRQSTVTAYQDSSTTFSKIKYTYPPIQVINTGPNARYNSLPLTLYSYALSPESNAINYATSWKNTTDGNNTIFFCQAIGLFDYNSKILGISLQYFGELNVQNNTDVEITVQMTYILNMYENNTSSPTTTALVIKYTLLPSTGKNGTMTFIPFSPDFYGTNMEMKPTNVTNLKYEGTPFNNTLVTPGSVISVSMTTSNSSGTIKLFSNEQWSNPRRITLAGSLVLQHTSPPPVYTFENNNPVAYDSTYRGSKQIFNKLYSEFDDHIWGGNGAGYVSRVVCKSIRIPRLQFEDGVYPKILVVSISYGSYVYTIEIMILNSNNSFEQTTTIDIECTMPTSSMMGSYEQRNANGYYIKAIRVSGGFGYTGGINSMSSLVSGRNNSQLIYQQSYPIFERVITTSGGLVSHNNTIIIDLACVSNFRAYNYANMYGSYGQLKINSFRYTP